MAWPPPSRLMPRRPLPRSTRSVEAAVDGAQTEILGVVRLLCVSEQQWGEARARVRSALNAVRSAASNLESACSEPPTKTASHD